MTGQSRTPSLLFSQSCAFSSSDKKDAAPPGRCGGIGIGIATGKATEAISRQPEASGKIQTNLLLGAALAEGTAIFGFVVALLIILFLGQ